MLHGLFFFGEVFRNECTYKLTLKSHSFRQVYIYISKCAPSSPGVHHISLSIQYDDARRTTSSMKVSRLGIIIIIININITYMA